MGEQKYKKLSSYNNFQAPTQWLTAIFNSSSRESDALFWPPWAKAHTWCIYIHNNTLIHIKFKRQC